MEGFWVIAGLGNPGKSYDNTRHNIGFDLLDLIADKCGGSSWKERDGAALSECKMGGVKTLLVKPLKFMNLSGEPLGQLMRFYKIGPENLIVVHDDIDLPFGVIRIRVDGRDGGHRGVRSIISNLGTEQFVRLKLGVGRPEVKEPLDSNPKTVREKGVKDWVLERFSKAENSVKSQFLTVAEEAVQCVVSSGAVKAQSRFNKQVVTPPIE